MRKRIIYLLKHNLIIQKIYRFFFSLFFRFIGLFVRTDNNLVLFLSMMGTRYNDSPKFIYEHLIKQQEFGHLKCVWAFENPKQFPDLETVKIDSFKFFITALKAKYWIASTHLERGLKFKKKNTVYLYTCHGTAIKLCGNSCPGRKDFDYSNVDYICVASEFDKNVMVKSFKANKNSFIETGRPCNDVLWDVDKHTTEDCKIKLGLPLNKKIILYAPTWRDSVDKGASYELKPPINFKKWEEKLGDEYVVLFRAHQITNKILGIEFNSFVRDFSEYPEINDLLIASDLLISDYSAVLTDFAILERPIFCFAYDYDDYLLKRGTYFDLNDKMPSGVLKTEDELIKKILSLDADLEKERTKKFKAEFDQFGGKATETCVDILFRGN